MHGRYFVGYCGVLVVLVAVMGVAVTANAIEQKKREWPIKLCTSDDDCNGGCCKGLFCFRYLGENERCLFGHHLKVGCGCEEPLSCKMKNFSYKCTKASRISQSSDVNSISDATEVVEELDRELQALLPYEATVASDNNDGEREVANQSKEDTVAKSEKVNEQDENRI